MLFKHNSYLDRYHLCNFGRLQHEEQFSEIILNLDQWCKRRCCFKIFYLELLWPFCSAERTHLYNVGRKYHEEQLSEFILNLDQWFSRRHLMKEDDV